WHYINHAPTIVQKLTSREQMGGMGMPGTTLALYHTRSSTVLQPVFTVYRLKSPLKVQGMQQEVQSIDTILMMLAHDNVSNEVLEVLSFISSLLVQQSGSAKLFANGSEYEIKQFLDFQLTQYIKQQHILEE